MASVHKKGTSKLWHCYYFDPVLGKRRFKSTGTADKAEAELICRRYEALAKSAGEAEASVVPSQDRGELVEAGLRLIHDANKGSLGEAQAREFVNRVLKAAGQPAIEGLSIGAFLENWLEGKALAKSEHTAQRYRTTVKLFKLFLGKRSETQLSAVNARDVEKFRNLRLKEVGASTVSDDLKILRTAFNAGRRQGLIHANPVEAVDLPTGETREREAFVAEEVQELLAATKDPEWKTAILFGFYAGLRLGDAVGLSWENVDLKTGTLRYRATKTKRLEELPLHPALTKHLGKLKGEREGKLCTTLAGQRIPGRSGLSRQFLDIMKAAGIDKKAQAGKDGRGRSFTGKSFHSLRHGFVSALANAGIAPELRQRLSGHTTADTHRKYTHLEFEPLRKAIRQI